jgi:hypothetical protein
MGGLRRFSYLAGMVFILTTSQLVITQELKDRELRPAFDFRLIQMPVEIVSMKVTGKEIQAGEKISGNDDWLRGLSFTLKNISDKPISFISMGLRVDRPTRILVYNLDFGFDPSSGAYKSESAPQIIAPGESVDLVLTKDKYAVFLKMLQWAEFSRSFDVAQYYVGRVRFENEPDVIWEGGNLKRRDPNSSSKFDVIEKYLLPARQK